MMGVGHPDFDAQLHAHGTVVRELTPAEHALCDAVRRRRGTLDSPPAEPPPRRRRREAR